MRFIYIYDWIKYSNIAEVISWVPTVHILLKVEGADFLDLNKNKTKQKTKQICLDQKHFIVKLFNPFVYGAVRYRGKSAGSLKNRRKY